MATFADDRATLEGFDIPLAGRLGERADPIRYAAVTRAACLCAQGTLMVPLSRFRA